MANTQDSVDDDGKLYQRYHNKRVNAGKEGLRFTLTYAQFVSLLVRAGIRSSQCGVRGFHLSRHNDRGNTRTVTASSNIIRKI